MKLEFWFDFSCPYAYLASRQAAKWASAGVEIDWRPMLLGGVFRGIASGPNGNGPMGALGLYQHQGSLRLTGVRIRMSGTAMKIRLISTERRGMKIP